MTRTLMDYMGLPADDAALAKLGYFPVIYDYPNVNADVESFTPDGGISLIDGKYTQKFKIVPFDEPTLQMNLTRIAAETASQARAKADEAVAPYMAEFSDVEKQTWAKQQTEVAAYLADNKAPTPTLDGLAQARGIDRTVMLQKAIAKVTAFEPLSVAIVGKQQAYEDQIKAVAQDEGKSLRERIGDSGYRGTFEADAVKKLGVEVGIIERPKGKKWEILPKR